MEEPTQTVNVDKRFGSQYEGAYVFKQITQGEYEKIMLTYMDASGKVAKQDVLKVNREAMWTALKEQPSGKPLNHELVIHGRLPYGLSLKLQEAYDKANGIDMDEQRFLSSPSEEKPNTLS